MHTLQTRTFQINSLVQGVALAGRLELPGDEDGDDDAVDGDDAGHDHGDDALHDELWPHDGHGGDAGAGLGRAVGGAHRREDHGGGGAQDAEEGRVDRALLGHLCGCGCVCGGGVTVRGVGALPAKKIGKKVSK